MHREEEQRFIELNQNWQEDCNARFAAYDQSTKDRYPIFLIFFAHIL